MNAVLFTQLSPSDCARVLQSSIEKDTFLVKRVGLGSTLADRLANPDRRKVIGRVNGAEFHLQWRDTAANCRASIFAPVLQGKLIHAEGGTRIETSCGMPRAVYAIMVALPLIVWILMTLLIRAVPQSTPPSDQPAVFLEWHKVLLSVILMLGGAFFADKVLGRIDQKRLLDFLMTTLSARVV